MACAALAALLSSGATSEQPVRPWAQLRIALLGARAQEWLSLSGRQVLAGSRAVLGHCHPVPAEEDACLALAP